MKNEIAKSIFSEEELRRRERKMSRFWEREDPETVEANRLQWRFYSNVGKLQIIRYYGYDRHQIITLDRRALTPAMLGLLKKFIDLEVEKEGE